MTAQEQTFSQKIIRGGLIITFFSLLTSPLGYFIRLMLSRSLTVEEYGLFYSILGFFGIFAVFNDLGFGYSVSYFIPKYLQKKNYSKVWNLYAYDQIIEVVTSVLISGVLLLFSGWLADHYFKMSEAKNLMSIFAVFFIANSFVSALQKFYNGIQEEKVYSSMESVRLLVACVLTFILWVQGITNVYLYAWSWVCGYIIVAIIYWTIQRIYYSHFISKLVWDKNLFIQMYTYAIPTLLVTSLAFLTTYIDTIILTLLKGVRDVGVYNVVFPLAAITGIIFSPIQNLFLPLISQYHSSNKTVVTMIINKLLLMIPFFGIYVGFFMFLFTETIITVLFGEQWVELSTFPLKILSLGYVGSLSAMYLATVVAALGKIGERLKVVAITFGAHLVLSFLLSYYYGVTGAVVANCCMYLLLCGFYLKIIAEEVQLQIPLLRLLQYVAALVIIWGVVYTTGYMPSTFIELFVTGIIYSALIFGIGTSLKILDWNVIKTFKQSH